MIGTLFHDIARQHHLTMASGMAYGLLNGCFVTLSEDKDVQRISIYVGAQEQPAPGYAESRTVSCAKQICQTISVASGADNLYSLMTGNETIPALILNHAGSVVTVNFPAAPEARNGIERFVNDLLPQVAPLTRPQQCIFCCSVTAGDACPVRLSADTVVPMHIPCYQQAAGCNAPTPAERSAQIRAVSGAVAGALFGAAVWSLLISFGPAAWIVGVLMGLLPTLVYDLLKGKTGKSRITTILACALAAVLLGTVASGLLMTRSSYASEAYLMDVHAVGYWAYTFAALKLPASGLTAQLLQNLIAGVIFAAIGCLGCFRRTGDASATAAADKPRRLKGRF